MLSWILVMAGAASALTLSALEYRWMPPGSRGGQLHGAITAGLALTGLVIAAFQSSWAKYPLMALLGLVIVVRLRIRRGKLTKEQEWQQHIDELIESAEIAERIVRRWEWICPWNLDDLRERATSQRNIADRMRSCKRRGEPGQVTMVATMPPPEIHLITDLEEVSR